MIIIVFLFDYRGDNGNECEHDNEYVDVVHMLDQLILLVQLSDVSVTSTNDYLYLM